MKPLVSIIIPNYNEERFIAKTIDSALNQTYENTEIIVVDDGSTDNSINIIKAYEEKYEKVTVLFQENANASMARNRGIEHARGEYYYFLDSDDIAYPETIETMVSKMKEDDADLVIGNMDEIDVEGKSIGTLTFFEEDGTSSDFSDFLKVMPAPPNKLFRAEIIKNHHVFWGNVNIGQDTNFFLKYMLCCQRIAYTNKVLYGWRHVPTSMTHAMDFHIFDIVNSFKNTRRFYHRNGADDKYMDYILMMEFHTYYRQMDKQKKFAKYSEKLLVINYFDYHIKMLGNLKECKNYSAYSKDVRNCRLKRMFKYLYMLSK